MSAFVEELRDYILTQLPELSGECDIYCYWLPDSRDIDHCIALIPTGGFPSDRDYIKGIKETPTVQVVSRDKSSRKEAMDRAIKIHYLFKDNLYNTTFPTYKVITSKDMGGYPGFIDKETITCNYVFTIFKLKLT